MLVFKWLLNLWDWLQGPEICYLCDRDAKENEKFVYMTLEFPPDYYGCLCPECLNEIAEQAELDRRNAWLAQ